MTSVPIRVLWVIKGLGPGGAERLLVSLAHAHDRDLVEPSAAYLLPWKDALVGELDAAGVDTVCIGGARGAADLRWVGRLRRLIDERRFDVVHSHSPMLASAARLVVRTLPRNRRPKLVTTEHNAWSTFALPTRLLNGLTAPLDDLSLAVSEEARSSMWWPGLRTRTEVLVHGVDLDAIDAARRERDTVRAELGVSQQETLVVTVANYRIQKAWPDLLAAARQVVDFEPNVRFAGVGQGPLADEIEREHERLGLGRRFALLGRRDDVPRILAAADLFALASTYEGYPVALMEALAVGHGVEGLLVPAGEPTAMADAIIGAARDPAARERMRRAARLRGRSFGIDTVARRLEEVYAGLLT